MSALLGFVDLLDDQKAVVVLAKAAKPIPPPAHRAHEVQAEAINVRLGLVGLKFCSAADAFPHAASVRLKGGKP